MTVVAWVFALLTAAVHVAVFVAEAFLITRPAVHAGVFAVPAGDVPSVAHNSRQTKQGARNYLRISSAVPFPHMSCLFFRLFPEQFWEWGIYLMRRRCFSLASWSHPC